jgi:orotidine-5'-phosphate decarboxylase
MPCDIPIYCAVDKTDPEEAAALVRAVQGSVGGMKIGKEFFTANGPQGVRGLAASGLPLFLDLKFHDIPNTVAGAVRAVCALNPAMINVHALGGTAMMRAAAVAAVEARGADRPLVLGVTVLTSLDDDDLADVGIGGRLTDEVVRLATLAQNAGLNGVVCAPQEIAALRRACGPDFSLVVPGIRLAAADAGDQKRTKTPLEARALGANVLVIGQAITAAPEPAAAARALAAELAAVA